MPNHDVHLVMCQIAVTLHERFIIRLVPNII